MADDIDKLQIEISAEAGQAIKGLDDLSATLNKLKSTVQGGIGLGAISKELRQVNTAANTLTSASRKVDKMISSLNALRSMGTMDLSALANSFKPLENIGKSNIGSITNALAKLPTVANQLETIDLSGFSGQLERVATSFKPLEAISKGNLSSVITSLRKLPQVAKELESINMEKFTKQINELAVALRPLSEELSKVANNFSMFPAKIQKFISQNQNMSKSVLQSNNSLGIMGTGIKSTHLKLGIFSIAVKRAGNVVSDWISKSNAYVENLNLFTVAMGKYADEALAFAKKVQSAMGIDMSEWIRNQGIFMQIATGFGVVEEKAYQMSKGLTQVSYDISSFFNIPIEEALIKVQSGISGELEPLRRLGYALDMATLQQIAYNMGIEENVAKMTQAQKSQLRYIAIMQQSKNVMGDMSRTLITPANALRILNQQFIQLQRALGDMLIPLLIKIIPYVQAFVQVITKAARSLAALFGFKIPEIDYSSLSTGIGGISDEADNASDSIGGVGDSLKKLKSMTAGFDELNIISQDTGAAADVGKGLGSYDLGVDLSQFDYDFLGGLEEQTTKIQERMESLLKVILAIGAAFALWKISSVIYTLLTTGFEGKGLSVLLTGITNVTRALWSMAHGGAAANSALTFLFKGTGIAQIAAIAAQILAVVGVITIIVTRVKELWETSETFRKGLERIVEIGRSLWNLATTLLDFVWEKLQPLVEIIKSIGRAIADLIPEEVKKAIKEFFQNFDLDWKDLGITALGFALLFVPGGKILGVVLIAFEAITLAIRALGSKSDETWEAIKKFFSDGIDSIKQWFIDGITKIKNEWNLTVEWFNTDVIKPLKENFGKLVDAIQGFFSNLWTKIKEIWSTVKEWFVLNVIDPIKEDFNLFKEAITGVFSSIWTTVQEIWLTVKEWFVTNVIDPIKEDFNLFKETMVGIFSDIWTKVKEVWGTVSEWFKTDVIDPVTEKFSTFKETITGIFSDIWTDIKTTFKSAADWFDKNVTTPIAGFFKTALNTVRDILNKLIDWINDKLKFDFKGLVIAGIQIVPAFSFTLFQLPKIPKFEAGGFPDTGQLFIAREAGAEMVGSIGRRTAVANNDQIVEAVSRGVYDAVVAALPRSNEQQLEVKVYLDGKEITKTVEKIQRERGTNLLPGGVMIGY